MSEPEKSAEPKGGWQDWATRTTAILAVVAALSSGRWGASNLQAILEQGKVNDTWAYFQAKSLKQHGAEQTRDLAAALAQGGPAERAAALKKLQAHLEDAARREEQDKNQRQRDAERFQARRDRLVESSFWYELSFAALQLGVILCTIAAGARRKTPWVIGGVCGLLGIVLFINGVYRFYPAPQSWYQGGADAMAYQDKSAPSPPVETQPK
ncbi:MAG TPA: DUF4337 domain-containing protein [Tepidisphaeraceae bacterium]|jgi:hypothetical protein